MKLAYRKTTTQDALAHALAVAICTGILFLFVALTYSQIVSRLMSGNQGNSNHMAATWITDLPFWYTTQYTEKDVQQLVNLIITIVATVVGILFSHCRRLTNEAETKTELHDERLTIPRLHVHFEAASGSKVAMGIPVAPNREVWPLVAFYFLAMIIFAFVHSVLSVIFVIEATISKTGELVPVSVPLSIDMPSIFDTCININDPKCTYDLALQALSSQLVTYQKYTIAGVTFEPGNGTLGLPYHALEHFANEVASSRFEDARRRYCLPVLDPHIIKCTEVLIDPHTCESGDGFVRFKSLNASSWNPDTNYSKNLGTGLYKITSPYPNPITDYDATTLQIDKVGRGVMVVNLYTPDPQITLVGGADAWGEHGYGTMLHRLMYHGRFPDTSNIPDGATYDFAAKCRTTLITDHDNVGSSWRQVDFTLSSGVLRANVTDERCPNARATPDKDLSGFGDLLYALQNAAAVISSGDGYSRFFNEHPATGPGTDYFADMSRLDSVVNQVYHIVQTFWTSIATVDQVISENPKVRDQPIMMTSYPHLFIIRISWTPVTYVGLVLSILVALMAWVLAFRWFRAVYQFGFGAETWNLLRPVDLMAYSLAASHDLAGTLNTKETRRMEMHGKTQIVLREHKASLINLLNGTADEKLRFDSLSNNSPSPTSGNDEWKPDGGDGVAVHQRDSGLGTASSVPGSPRDADQERDVDLERGRDV